MNCKLPLGFEFGLQCSFSMTIAVTPQLPPYGATDIYIYIYIYIYIMSWLRVRCH